MWRSWAGVHRRVRSLSHGLRLLRGAFLSHTIRTMGLRLQRPDAMRILADTADHHVARRAALTKAQILDAAAEVTVVCVTQRPSRLSEAIANYQRQRYPNKRFVLITNSAAFDLDAVRVQMAALDSATSIHMDESTSLGACLNLGIERSSTRYLAKFDDDDSYGEQYLTDMMLAHRLVDAVIVGKKSYFAYLADLEQYVLRFPGHEYTYTSHVSGATLVIDLSRIGRTRFPAVSVGEDTAFIRSCQRNSGSIFSADRFNYLQFRGTHNTWTLPSEDFARGSLVVDPKSRAGAINL